MNSNYFYTNWQKLLFGVHLLNLYLHLFFGQTEHFDKNAQMYYWYEVCIHINAFWEHSGSVVEYLSRDRRAAGLGHCVVVL